MLIEDFIKLDRSRRNAIFAAIIIIALIAIYSWIVAPHTTCLEAAQQHESTTESLAKRNKLITTTIKNKGRELEKLHEKLALIQDVLFTPDEGKKFFGNLQTTSEQAGCVVHSLNLTANEPDAGNRPEGVSDITIQKATLSVVGAFDDIIGLIDTLQSYNKKVWMDSLEMETFKDGLDKIKCDMTLVIYVMHNEAKIVGD